MSVFKPLLGIAVCSAFFVVPSSYSTTITIDPTKQYQTMDGFGCFGYAADNWCGSTSCIEGGSTFFSSLLKEG